MSSFGELRQLTQQLVGFSQRFSEKFSAGVQRRAYSPDLKSAATLRLGLILADRPGLEDTVLALASHEAALACSAVGAS